MSDLQNTTKSLRQFLSCRAELVTYAARLLGDRARGEDIVQEAYIRFSRLDKHPNKPLGYLKRIVRNLSIDVLRRSKTAMAVPVVDDTLGDERPDPERQLVHRQDLQAAVLALQNMPPNIRQALNLYRFEGLTLQQVATHMSVSVSTAHALVQRGLVLCRQAIKDTE